MGYLQRNHVQGPYGTFGKVDDFKIVGTKTESKGKRDYRLDATLLSVWGLLSVPENCWRL